MDILLHSVGLKRNTFQCLVGSQPQLSEFHFLYHHLLFSFFFLISPLSDNRMKQRKATHQPTSTKWKQRSLSILIFQPLTETTTPSCTPWRAKRQKLRTRSPKSSCLESCLFLALPAPSRTLAKCWWTAQAMPRFRPRMSHCVPTDRLTTQRPLAPVCSPMASTAMERVWIRWRAEIQTPSRKAGRVYSHSSASHFPQLLKRAPSVVTLV